MSINKKALILVVLLFLTYTAFFIQHGLKRYDNEIDQLKHAGIAKFDTVLGNVREFALKPYHQRIKGLLGHQEIVDALVTGDRQLLLKAITPRYRVLKNENRFLAILQFIRPDSTVFLRVQQPERYGDLLDGRESLVRVHQTRQQVTGFEMGDNGCFYRVIEPIVHNGRYLGALELGISVRQLEAALNERLAGRFVLYFDQRAWARVSRGEHDPLIFNGLVLPAHGETFWHQLPPGLNFSRTVQEVTIAGKTYVLHRYPIFGDQGGLLGLQDISMPLSARQEYLNTALLYGAIFLTLAVLILNFFFNKLIGSLEEMHRQQKSILGDLRQEVQERIHTEEALREARDSLEQKVEERTAELARTNEALQEEVTERIELNNSLARSLEESETLARELEEAYGKLKASQATILQQEKMASIGQLAAGVAHEINNPIGFISSNLHTLNKYSERLLSFIEAQSRLLGQLETAKAEELARLRRQLKIDFLSGDIASLIEESLEGAVRVSEIVQNLKSFSRLDQQQRQAADINECLESTLKIVWNELKYKARVEKKYGNLPPLTCYPQQLNQVFLNLLVNAAQAIEEQGTITIGTRADEEGIEISIADSGRGIAPQHLDRIFEPFFTTKEVGQGTGLGLSIVYEIIKQHGGEISVASREGEGTTFTIRLPLHAAAEEGPGNA